jgi:hypothetical protein
VLCCQHEYRPAQQGGFLSKRFQDGRPRLLAEHVPEDSNAESLCALNCYDLTPVNFQTYFLHSTCFPHPTYGIVLRAEGSQMMYFIQLGDGTRPAMDVLTGFSWLLPKAVVR